MAKIWFLTGNAGKVEEAKHHFAEHGYVVEQLVVDQEIIEPQADSLTQVAQAKIAQALEHMPGKEDMLLVEDAGLFVETLGGFPWSLFLLRIENYWLCWNFVITVQFSFRRSCTKRKFEEGRI